MYNMAKDKQKKSYCLKKMITYSKNHLWESTNDVLQLKTVLKLNKFLNKHTKVKCISICMKYKIYFKILRLKKIHGKFQNLERNIKVKYERFSIVLNIRSNYYNEVNFNQKLHKVSCRPWKSDYEIFMQQLYNKPYTICFQDLF
jgi:hypothetical protein